MSNRFSKKINFGKSEVSTLRNVIFTPEKRLRSPIECLYEFSDQISQQFSTLFSDLCDEFGHSDGLCLIAVGGYGRGELFPYSDIDLLLLYKTDAASMIGAFERAAWDTGLLLGFTARTPDQCSQILGDDYATDTAMLESTFIAGDFLLFTDFIERILRPYFVRNRRKFLNEMRCALVQGIDSTVDSLYRIEPDVKNGICCLRDCHRLIWAEKVTQGIIGGKIKPDLFYLEQDDRQQMLQSYSFLAKIRTELHLLSKRRLDILEVGLQKIVAQSIGCADGSPEKLMGDFYRAVTVIRQSIFSFIEIIHRNRNFAGKFRSAFASFNAGNGLTCIDGILHIKKDCSQIENEPLWILDTCISILICHAEPGLDVRNKLREITKQLTPIHFRNHLCETKFCAILADKRHSGRVIKLMHETGVLELLIPEFAPLAFRVEFDTYHEYTVDQHTLLAVRAFDDLVNDKDILIRSVFLRIVNRRVFRLALLLHDAGKACCGDHCRDGAIIALNAAARLGFSQNEQEQVAFLVYHHLDMSELSLRRTTEDDALRQFAETVGSHTMLDMLYILTVLDIRHVGIHSMTGWKSAQLAEIFNITDKLLNNLTNFNYSSPIFNYTSSVLPEDRSMHSQWIANLSTEDMQFHIEKLTGFYRVTIITQDRLSLLADIAACFVAAGLQIISAQVYSLEAGNIIDIFDVEPEAMTVLSIEERRKRFITAWNSIENGNVTSYEIVKKKFDSYPRKINRQLQMKTSVKVNNHDSRNYTILEICSPDRFGLFYTIVHTLGNHHFNINAARIATSVDIAIDIFYIKDENEDKVTDKKRIDSLIMYIIDALK